MDEEEQTELTTTTTKGKDGGTEKDETKNEEETVKSAGSNNDNNNLDNPSDPDIASQSSIMSGDESMADLNQEQDSWQKFRRALRLEVVQTSWFETVILIVIIINCVFLALDNPTNDSETLEELRIYLFIKRKIAYYNNN